MFESAMGKKPFFTHFIWFCKQHFHPYGRLSRIEYLNTQLFNFILFGALYQFFTAMKWESQSWAMVLMLFIAVTLMIMAAIKRLRDMHEPATRLVYSLFPIVGLYFMLEPYFKPGYPEESEGIPPPSELRFDKQWLIFQSLLPLLYILLGYVMS
jgi:uncharacterized membrane protein YhaH (DUF805 family)